MSTAYEGVRIAKDRFSRARADYWDSIKRAFRTGRLVRWRHGNHCRRGTVVRTAGEKVCVEGVSGSIYWIAVYRTVRRMVRRTVCRMVRRAGRTKPASHRDGVRRTQTQAVTGDLPMITAKRTREGWTITVWARYKEPGRGRIVWYSDETIRQAGYDPDEDPMAIDDPHPVPAEALIVEWKPDRVLRR